MTSNTLSHLTKDAKLELLESLKELDTRLKYNKAKSYFPDDGPLGRQHFKKQIAFMNAGVCFLERCLLGSNRSAKSETCSFESYLHATGNYDECPWFTGIKFNPAEDITIWLAAPTHDDIKSIQQVKLFGPAHSVGTGLIPKDSIVDIKTKQGIPNAYSEVLVRRKGGGLTTIVFKAYMQGRESFQGSSVHFIGLDEECPQDIYEECVTRCATVNGRIALYFTPLSGLTELVTHFLPNGKIPSDHIVPGRSAYVEQITWEDVPDAILPQEMRKQLEATYLPHQREARMRGMPVVHEGKIFTTPESTCVVPPFKIPSYWPKYYSIDIGYKCTAALWFAKDPNTGVLYVYDEYYSEESLPATHVQAIKSRGEWMSGVIDPSALKTSSHDGIKSFNLYRDMGLNLSLGDNRIQAGLMACNNLLSTGMVKFFNHLTNTLEEYRLYRYAHNKKTGETIVAKAQRDHAMDAFRYGVMATSIAQIFIDPDEEKYSQKSIMRSMNRNPVTGY